MFERDAYVLLMQFLNTKIRYMGDNKSLLVLDTLRDTYALAIHKIELPQERQADIFLTYLICECHVGYKVLVRNTQGMCGILNIICMSCGMCHGIAAGIGT